MANIKINDLLLTGKNAELNTWQRYKKVLPSINKNNDYIELSTTDKKVKIGRFEEAILNIIVEFHFCPAWLVEKWLLKNEIIGLKTPKDTIISWIDIGLVWIEASVTGEYLRPSWYLFELFGLKPKSFVDIPFNKLTHTISEEQVMFSVMTGQEDDPICNNFDDKLIKRFSPLGLKINNNEKGTNIIREDEFRSISIYTTKAIPETEESEAIIREEIRQGLSVTSELKDFKKFMIVKKINNTGNLKKDYLFHVPDLIIPLPRTNGKANSIAIEIELTKKSLKSYKNIMYKYKDNQKFGTLIYLSNNGDISKLVKEAYKEENGLGNTNLLIYEFIVPSPKLTYKIK